MLRRSLSLGLLALVAGCSGSVPSEPATRTDSLVVSLQRVESCDELEALIRENARADMNAELDALAEQLKSGTMGLCLEYDAAPGVATGGGGTSAAGPTSVSETNNQVSGVDEADRVKTDGQYIYLAQASELRIVDAWPAAEASATSRLALGGTAKKLFVYGDRALVYVSVPRSGSEQSAWMAPYASDCTYGYDCDFSGDGSATRVLVIDVTDRSAPRVVRTLDFPGSLIAARRIGATVHTVVSIGEIQVPELEQPSVPYCTVLTDVELAAALDAVETARAHNDAIIDAAHFDLGEIGRENGAALGAADCTDFFRETSADGGGVTTVVSLDLEGTSPPTLANIFSRAGAVYASASSLYMSVSHQRSAMDTWYANQPGDEASTVHQFRIGEMPTETAYLASGIVPGRVLNQFSMDEHEGVLRIATTKGHVPDPDVESTLSVLRRNGGTLELAGQIDGIAPTEDIRSVRFDGDRGYLVTFKKTDPLFVLDLADPAAPRVVGELKIPGFSTYMHRLDAGHLLALGYEGDDQGDFAYFNGIQLQIFDVTDPTSPSLLHKVVYGTRGSSSSALTDHLGFTFLADRGLLTLPMSICDGGGNGQFGTLSFSGVVALNVSVAAGIQELGRLEEPYPAGDGTFYYGAACSDWWTSSNSVVSRTVVLDDYVYAISENRVRVQSLSALGTDVSVVDFAAP